MNRGQGGVPGQAPATEPALLMQLSDLHFGTERPEVVEALVALVQAQRPRWVVVSGDLTQRATHPQFQAARVFLDRLQPATVLATPGNHDLPLFHLPLRLAAPYRRYARWFGADREPTLDAPELQLSLVDTTRWWRHERGAISPAQRARIAARLQAARPGQWRIVVTHHPLLAAHPDDAPDRPWGHAQALQAWAAAGADLLLSGHVHRPSATPQRCAAEGRITWVVQAGTSVSSRTLPGVPQAVNLLRQGRAGAAARTLERWEHAPAQGGFVRVQRQLLPTHAAR